MCWDQKHYECAVGQKTTQWCTMVESARGELREVYAALDDVRVDNAVTLPEAVRRLRTEFPEQVGRIEGLTINL